MNNGWNNNWNNSQNGNMNNGWNNNWNNSQNGNMNNWNNLNQNNPNYNCIHKRELEHMKALYTTINSGMMPYVMQVLDEYEYIGSPMYSYSGIDRESLSQLVDKVINLSRVSLDQIDEIYIEQNSNIGILEEWDRWRLLRGVIESLILTEIFSSRRPNYFNTYMPNIF